MSKPAKMNIPAKTYRSIFISDVHLGLKGCQADALCEFLKHNTEHQLYLVGGIIDGWRMKKKWYWPQSHTNVMRRILTAAKRDAEVTYIIGNHDEFLQAFLRFRVGFGAIKIANRAVHIGEDGDMFNGLMRPGRKWFIFIGDNAYNFLLWLNVKLNTVRRMLGLPYWSLSKE